MIIGPLREDDKENIVKGHGVLLMQTQKLDETNKYNLNRIKRKVDSNFLEQFREWPMEFDHLLMPVESNNIKNVELNNSEIKVQKLNDLITSIGTTTDILKKISILPTNAPNNSLNDSYSIEANTK